ncbi:helix-turn-helix transcriptional regulator [Alteromonas gracilis]|uniref:helix-turn-helix transcriptional regulator n=1 Tax=Alteromonas gracilis TaxID=1479524 RepID=UPI0030CA6B95
MAPDIRELGWHYGRSLTLENNSGEQTFCDKCLILGINLGSSHKFTYDDGSLSTRYSGILESGTVQLTPANIKHNASWENACFNLMFLDTIRLGELFENTPISLLSIDSPKILMKNKFLALTVKELINAVTQKSMNVYLESLLISIFYNIQYNVSQHNNIGVHKGLSRQDPRWLKLYQYIEDNIDKKLHLDELANQVNLSKFHFSREYKRIFGETIFESIKRKRLEYAASLLRNTDMNISEIARFSGFVSLSHFSYSFKVFYKVSPMTYRSEQK